MWSWNADRPGVYPRGPTQLCLGARLCLGVLDEQEHGCLHWNDGTVGRTVIQEVGKARLWSWTYYCLPAGGGDPVPPFPQLYLPRGLLGVQTGS